MTGIYSITNTETGDVYIGSAVNIHERWRRHRKDLRRGVHHSRFMQRSWSKYGESCFVFEVIEECAASDIIDRENFHLQDKKPAFNTCPFAFTSLGRKGSKQECEKKRAYAILNGIRPPASTWENKSRSVISVDKKTGSDVCTFKSLSEACRYIGRDSRFASTIADCCNGGRHKTFGGYKWKWNPNNKIN